MSLPPDNEYPEIAEAAPASASASLPLVAPDIGEELLRDEIDNSVPAFGYQTLPVVGLGGSAGSLMALQTFLQAVPENPGMAFVVVTHLAPENESLLAEILQRSTSMPVRQVLAKTEVEANCVYVIPPGKHLLMLDGHLDLRELNHPKGRRVAVDLFFRTLADTHGPHAAAIVLSGGDSDGSIGIKRIKERGGLTVAQDPNEAEHEGMPRHAIDTGMVDWVLTAAEMPGRLAEYRANESRVKLPPEEVEVPVDEQQDSEHTLRELLAFLRMRTGRDFSYYKRATILRRIGRRMQVNNVLDMAEYLTFCRTHAGEAGALLQDLLISVTNFFRDRDSFNQLVARLPEFFKGRVSGEPIRVWVVACATGEEAYSLAMLLCEYADRMKTRPRIQIFATDIDEQAINTARQGIYTEAIATDVSEERLRRFFIKDHAGYHVTRELREMVLFALHDLLRDSPFSRLDLVTCRNLLIYLNREAQAKAFEIFHFATRSEGGLFLGSSESAEEAKTLFSTINKTHRIYSRRGVGPGGKTVLNSLSPAITQLNERAKAPLLAFSSAASAERNKIMSTGEEPHARIASWEGLHFKLIEDRVPPSVIVDDNHDIVHLSNKAGRFLHFGDGNPSINLLRVAHPMLRVELRTALFRAVQTHTVVNVQGIALEFDDGKRTSVDITVRPGLDLAANFLLVIFEENEQPEPIQRQPSESVSLVQHLEQEIEHLKQLLRGSNEQHEVSVEELKASNEELQAMNEELRSATEELETSREEMQSINEELITVNQELKSKVDEVSLSNNDLQNLMASTHIATIFLDRRLRIKRYTPAAVALINLIPSDIGRPLADLRHRLDYEGIHADAERVLEKLVPVEREVCDQAGRWFLVRMLPYRTIEDQIGGVVLTFVDITEIRTAQQSLERSRLELLDSLQETTEAQTNAERAGKIKDEFLAVLSHELRTPLTPVLMAVQSMSDDPALLSEHRELFAMIERNVMLETYLIDDLLDITRIARGEMKFTKGPTNVHEAVHKALEICMEDLHAKKHQVHLELAAASSQLNGDAVRLQQVFWNLLKNACKFTDTHGQIWVRSRNEGDRLIVEVTDTGIGIPEKDLPIVFDTFRQADTSISRKFGGLGLGLAIAKATINAHGGTIQASSGGQGRGATFTVQLPLNSEVKDD